LGSPKAVVITNRQINMKMVREKLFMIQRVFYVKLNIRIESIKELTGLPFLSRVKLEREYDENSLRIR